MGAKDQEGGFALIYEELPENVHLLADHPDFQPMPGTTCSAADRALACAFIELHYEERHVEAALLARCFPDLLTKRI